MISENKQYILNKICEALQATRQFHPGTGVNGLKELRYIKRGDSYESNVRYEETARPIFEDGTGSDGWYDIDISCDSGTAIFTDVARQFVARM